MTNKNNFSKLLRSVFKENVSLNCLIDFRVLNPTISWTELIYKETGDTILHIVSRLGKKEIVLYIVNNWPPKCIDVRNNDGKTPLHEAAQFSQPEIVKILLNENAQIDAIKRADWTPLMLASTKIGQNSYETINVLLKSNACVNLINKDGWTALHLACRSGDVKILNLLLNYSNDSLINLPTKNGRTILHIACLHGNTEIVKILLNNYKLNINISDKCGNTPFHDAVCSANIELIKYLISNGSTLYILNKAGFSALHLAAAEGLNEIILFLIEELKMDINIKTSSNMTALHCAARNNKIETVKLLLKLGVNPDVMDNYNRTYLKYLQLKCNKN